MNNKKTCMTPVCNRHLEKLEDLQNAALDLDSLWNTRPETRAESIISIRNAIREIYKIAKLDKEAMEQVREVMSTHVISATGRTQSST